MFNDALKTPLGSRTEDLLRLFRRLQYYDEECLEDGMDDLPDYQAIMPL